jgi:hypothetical protein
MKIRVNTVRPDKAVSIDQSNPLTGVHPQHNEFYKRNDTNKTGLLYQWVYRVIEPDGKAITIEEYFETNDFKERYKKYLEKQPEVEVETPVYVGTLTKAFGIKGYTKADIGHPVFELGGKYIITIYDEKTNLPHVVSFYKESLQSIIQQ